MGTDIHGVFQRRTAAGWEDIESNYDQHRHYQLFAVLADVRNGRGFAGVRTGDEVVPISEPRGYPADFKVGRQNDEEGYFDGDFYPMSETRFMGRRAEWHEPGEPIGLWMGDHSHTWLTGAEMLAWYANAPTTTHHGIISVGDFKEWDRKSRPQNYAGGVWGRGVHTISQHEAEVMFDPNIVSNDTDVAVAAPPVTHVQVSWQTSLREELAYFFDEVARLVSEHGDVRFVFGFDS